MRRHNHYSNNNNYNYQNKYDYSNGYENTEMNSNDNSKWTENKSKQYNDDYYYEKDKSYKKYKKPKKYTTKYSKEHIHQYLATLDVKEIPELTKSLIDQLIEADLECLICQEEIKHTSQIWQCNTCYSIIHLQCIFDWIYKKNSSESDNKSILKWTCPHCNNDYEHSIEKMPTYNCFCEKYNEYSTDPYFDPTLILIPHTCGLNCEAIICDHTICSIPCHPGPHIGCNVIEDRYCHCGKEKKSIACTNPHKTFSCAQICDKLFYCGRHKCRRLCHDGECLDSISKKCLECTRESKLKFNVFLTQLEAKIKSELNEDVNLVEPLSDYIFEGKLMCDTHYMDINTDESLKFLLKIIQISGKNLIENIKKFIPLCKSRVENSCQCKNKSKETLCYKLNYDEGILKFLGLEKDKEFEMPNCAKVCKTLKTCKMHMCERLCCNLRNKNIRTVNQDPNGYHICLQECGRILNCGIHKCDETCHKNCKPCANIIRDKTIYCECGNSCIEPPYICGSTVLCQLPCSKKRSCEHPCKLTCHQAPCPPCDELTFKFCNCRKEVIQNVICGGETPFCKNECGSMLPCGAHFCKLMCHDHTDEFDKKYLCKLECGRPLECGHNCKMLCHGDEECNENSCPVITKIYCKCIAKIGKNMRCGDVKKKPVEERFIECNEECKKKERLRKIENMFGDLLKFNSEKNKIFNKKETKLEYIEDLDREKNTEPKYVDIKWDYKLVWLAMNRPKFIIEIENTIEKAVRNQSKTFTIENIDKKSYSLVYDYLTLSYNLEVDKGKGNADKTKTIVIIDASKALLPRYKLSLFGVLFRHHNFIRNPDFYHPFEFSIELTNYNYNVNAEEIELILQKYANKNDFYLVEIQKGRSYVHFFSETNGKRVFKAIKETPNQLEECYPITHKIDQNALTYKNLYMYLHDENYYRGLITEENMFRYNRKHKEEKEEKGKHIDEDGFVFVTKPKKKV